MACAALKSERLLSARLRYLFYTNFLKSKGSSQSGVGNSNSIYCGGFLNDFPAATTDAKIRGNLSILFSILSILEIDLRFFTNIIQYKT